MSVNAPPADKLTIEMVDRLVRSAANRYCARARWADFDDLYQSGFLSALEATRTYEPTRGLRPTSYIWRAILMGMARSLWNTHLVVSGGKHRPRATSEKVSRAPEEELAPVHAHTPSPEEAYADAEHRSLVRARIRTISRGSATLAAVALEELTAVAAAERLNVSREHVVRAKTLVIDASSKDGDLRKLLEDLTP